MIPETLRLPGREEWIDRLPRLVDELVTDWGLSRDGDPMAGACAIVLPVRTPEGVAAALKVSWPHWEAETEHVALRDWNGFGAVRLLRADPRRFALLLERADGSRSLAGEPVVDAIEVVLGLYPPLHIAAPPQTRTLSRMSADWADRLDRIREHGAVPRRLVEQAATLARDFAADPDTDGRLIHTDLHYENVLASLRGPTEPWLVIDPKPLSGDPAYEIAPLLWNRWDDYDPGRIRDGVLDRLYQLVDGTGWDEDRVRAWVIVRELCNVLWSIEDDVLDHDWLTRCITVAKAAQR